MENTLQIGYTNEIRCLLDFQSRGYYCSIPYSGSCRYDMIVDINNKLYKIQCKSSYYKDGVLVMNTHRQTVNTKEVKKYLYTKDEVDYYYTSYKNYGFLVPFENPQSMVYLRLEEPLGGIQYNMNIASDYLIDNVIESIISEKSIKKYIDNRFISVDSNGNKKEWVSEELHKVYTDRQIRRIKECIGKNSVAYGMEWKFKDFPTIM